ncbi:uncharacterized protein LOC129595764 [Paramacrobiotus metropolitanus]|uniref:uncharacterized protein LOC129595764 n=1 Tax=Paramacrobiotus metropolitanus TaxID=2943436 RepID=UPI0024458892|nr:uncharacterized protein LOC129595764 [Paramacrobiotus metropolitanus]
MATIIIGSDWMVDDSAEWSWKEHDQLMRCALLTIVKCVRPLTQHLVVEDRQRILKTEDFLQLADVIDYLEKSHAGIRLSTVCLVDFKFSLALSCSHRNTGNIACSLHMPSAPTEDASSSTLHDFIVACRGLPCNTVWLSSCTLHLDSGVLAKRGRSFFHPEITVDFGLAQLTTRNDFEGSLWNAIEARLSELDELELARLSNWLMTLVDNSNDTINTACWVLCAAHTADPRPWLNYRGKAWCMDGLQDVQLEKLSRIALHFLKQFRESLDTCSLSSSSGSSCG